MRDKSIFSKEAKSGGHETGRWRKSLKWKQIKERKREDVRDGDGEKDAPCQRD